MSNDEIKEVEGYSPDFKTELADKLNDLIPEVVADGKIDLKKLGEVLDDDTDHEKERFGLFWPGKKKAIKSAQIPTSATLKPAPEISKNWDTTENVYIEGDNLEVLKVLQKQYHNKIKMIYIDPPYNTGKDFVYPDNYQEGLKTYLEYTGQTDENGRANSTNKESDGRFHSHWLNMMYPRLKLARNLLTDDGVIFISIDDHEQANLKKLCDEIFGEENFLGQIVVETANGVFGTRATGLDSTLVKVKDYVIVYAKSDKEKKFRPLFMPTNDKFDSHYSIMLDKDMNRTSFIDYIGNNDTLKKYFLKYQLKISLENVLKIMSIDDDFNELLLSEYSDKIYQDVDFSLKIPVEVDREVSAGKIVKFKEYILFKTNSGNGQLRQLIPFKDSLKKTDAYCSEYRRAVAIGDLWEGFDNDMKNVLKESDVPFDSPKPVRLIRQLCKWCNLKENEIVLDFFAGSATTAHSLMQFNVEEKSQCRFILVQLPENLDKNLKTATGKVKKTIQKAIKLCDDLNRPHLLTEVSEERIRRAGEKIKTDFADKLKDREKPLDVGFRVYKLAPTNFKKWQGEDNRTVEEVQQSLLDMTDVVDSSSKELDILIEVLLKSGYPLTTKIKEFSIDNLKLWSANNDALVAILNKSNKPTLEQLRKIAEIDGLIKLIVLDEVFNGDDELKTNLAQICKTKNIVLETA